MVPCCPPGLRCCSPSDTWTSSLGAEPEFKPASVKLKSRTIFISVDSADPELGLRLLLDFDLKGTLIKVLNSQKRAHKVEKLGIQNNNRDSRGSPQRRGAALSSAGVGSPPPLSASVQWHRHIAEDGVALASGRTADAPPELPDVPVQLRPKRCIYI